VFPVRYELDFYIVFRRNTLCKGLMEIWPEHNGNFLLGHTGFVTQSLYELEFEDIS
jgi:hypothetical protein